MSAGVFKDPFIDCDQCGHRLFGSRVSLAWGGTIADLRRVAKKMKWKTGVENIISEGEDGIVRGPRLDLCPSCHLGAS